jgi:O-acetylserine/cysteine efflux transporter
MMPVKDMLLLLLVALSWGSGNAAATLIVHEMPPIWAAVIRFALTGLVLLPFLRVPKAKLPHLLPIALASGPIHFGLLYTAFSMTNNVGAMTVGGQLWVAFATILSVVFLKEHLNRAQVLGLLLAFSGIFVIGVEPHILADLDALLVMVCAAFCWGTSAFLARRAGDIPGLTVQAWMAILCVAVLLPMSYFTESGQIASTMGASWKLWLLMLHLVFAAGIFGNVMMFQMVRKYQVTQTTPFLLMTPVFAQIFGFLFLGEVITTKIILGTAITLAGVMALTYATARKTGAATAAA